MSEIIQSTTQQFLDIFDITNDFVIMKDGTISTILTVDAMNFGLLAEEEQDAIMYAYAGLLNSLNYTVQILIDSRTKDVTSYLKVLQEQEVVAENETLRRRIRMYREFVGNLIHERNVLDKKFYVVIPATALEMGFLAPASLLPGKTTSFDITSLERSVLIEKAKNLLDPKRDHLIAQFGRIGLFSRQLTTQEIIQLFYVRYNPEAAEGQQIGESNSYTTPLVKASIQGNFMNNSQTQSPDSLQLPDEARVQPLPEIHVATAPPAVEILTTPEDTPTPTAVPPTLPSVSPPATESAPTPPEEVGPSLTPVLPPIPPAPAPEPVVPPATQEIETMDSIAQPTSVTTPAEQPTEPNAVKPVLTETEQQAQDALNASLQALGSTKTPPAMSSTPQSDLPPLPEI